MKEAALEFLSGIGITDAEDDSFLDYILRNVQTKVANLTNRTDFPEGLQSVTVYMAVGEYLAFRKGAGTLEGFELDEAAVKSIQEGDTNITFAIGEGNQTPEQRLNGLIDYLLHGREAELYHFRRLVW